MTTPSQMPESLKVPEELAAIQQALDAGPTPGPWFASNRGSYGVSEGDEGSVYDEYGEDVGAEFVKPIGHLPTIRGELWYRDAAFVAACNPAAMTAVLSHISALQAALKDRDAEIERLKKDAEHHRQLFNFSKLGHEQQFAQCQRLSGLLRRSLAQLGKWQRTYGEHNPAWLPPAGDVELAEAIDAAIDSMKGDANGL